MSGSGDDEPVLRRGAVRPPGPAPGEEPDSVHMPRMEPPPASLEAMVQNRGRRPDEGGSGWLVWVVVLVLAAAAAGYVMK